MWMINKFFLLLFAVCGNGSWLSDADAPPLERVLFRRRFDVNVQNSNSAVFCGRPDVCVFTTRYHSRRSVWCFRAIRRHICYVLAGDVHQYHLSKIGGESKDGHLIHHLCSLRHDTSVIHHWVLFVCITFTYSDTEELRLCERWSSGSTVTGFGSAVRVNLLIILQNWLALKLRVIGSSAVRCYGFWNFRSGVVQRFRRRYML